MTLVHLKTAQKMRAWKNRKRGLFKSNEGKNMHEELKILRYDGMQQWEYYNSGSNQNSKYAKNENNLFKKFSDKIKQKSTNPEDNIKQTNQTHTNQVQTFKDTNVQNYNRNNIRDILGTKILSRNSFSPQKGQLFSSRLKSINKNLLNGKSLQISGLASPRHISHPHNIPTPPDNKDQFDTESNILE